MEIASKSSRKYKQVLGVALSDQEIGPGWSINSSIKLLPETNLKCSQKQPKTKIYTFINMTVFCEYIQIIPGYATAKNIFLLYFYTGISNT